MLNVFSRRATLRARTPFQILVALLGIGSALPATHAAGPAPEQAAPVPFKHYQAWRDEPLQDWQQANERVGEIGGWRTYLRESQPVDGGAVQDPQAHHGHHGH